MSDTKFLGVIVDNKFTWKKHIDTLSSKISQQIGILKKVKYKLSSSTLTLLYNFLIQPHFYYCTIIWGSAYETNLTHLQSLQKQAIRVITFCKYNAHSAPLFVGLKKLHIKDIYKIQLIAYIYKCKHSLVHKCIVLPDQFTSRSHQSYDMRNLSLSVPYCRTNTRRSSAKFAGIITWNSLISKLNSNCITSIYQLKSFTTNLLLSNYDTNEY